MPLVKRTERKAFDFYETPPHYLRALPRLPMRGTVLEPCVGNGAIIQWAAEEVRLQRKIDRSIHVDFQSNDIDKRVLAGHHLDASRLKFWRTIGKVDWTITNPPFSRIEPILGWALKYSRNVVSLARLSFLEPTNTRRQFFANHMPDLVIVLPRYKFSEPSKDMMTCCWIGWGPDVPKVWMIDTMEPPK